MIQEIETTRSLFCIKTKSFSVNSEALFTITPLSH